MTTLVMWAVLFFGIFAYTKLPISDLPSVAYPTIVVKTQNPGSDANTMATTVAVPLEQQLMTIPGINSVVSQSNAGQTNIVLTFDLSEDIATALAEVAAAINQAEGNLPSDLPQPPQYQRYNPTDTPISWIACSSYSMNS
ncbi:MAG: efflux RND transporter permease subunit, partial [Verrucomicrobia bacterium]|nr:efflux RND transporter permease subunit [Verrucomicrobiota bacterium]